MNIQKQMEEKKSVRSYMAKKIPEKYLQALKSYFQKGKRLEKNHEMELYLLSNKQVFHALNGIAGYHGVMIDAPHYALLLSTVSGHYIENAGYVAEDLCLEAFSLGIDSCMITFPSSRSVIDCLKLLTEKEVVGLIALGYGNKEQPTVISHTKTGDNYANADIQILKKAPEEKLPVEELVYIDHWGKKATADALAERAVLAPLLYASLSPSTLNRQPWRFLIASGKLVLAMKKDPKINPYEEKIDAGIVMLYLERIVTETLFPLRWEFLESKDAYDIPEPYAAVAVCSL